MTLLSGAMLESIGLGGDGDEVDAVERVEAVFGIAFDHEDCQRFVTVGNVWDALRKELRVTEEEAAPLWPRFTEELSWETGVDPTQVRPATSLLAPAMPDVMKDGIRRLFGR